MPSRPTDISLEPLLNRGKEDGDGIRVTPISEVGAVSNRTAVTVTATAQEITIGSGKRSIEFHNSGGNNIYYGGSGVTSSTGIPIFTDEGRIFNKVASTFSIYVVCATGETSTLRIVEYT